MNNVQDLAMLQMEFMYRTRFFGHKFELSGLLQAGFSQAVRVWCGLRSPFFSISHWAL